MHRRSRQLTWMLCVAYLLAALASPARAAVTMGAMGDSYTDEYSQFGDPTFYNWVDTLVASGRADFGPLASFPSSDPRNPGLPTSDKSYTYNFAKGGARTDSASFRGTGAPNYLNSQFGSPTQPATWGGIRALGLAGAIEYAEMFIGGNDILGNINSGFNFKNGLNNAALDTIFARYTTALDVATANGTSPLKMLLPNMPDLGSMPYMTNGAAGFTLTPTQQANVRANVQGWNERLATLAAARDIAVVDWWGTWEEVRLNQPVVHGNQISVTAFFLADGIHPSEIGQALFANKVIESMKTVYGETDVTLLSPKELVTITGLDPQDAPMAHAGNEYQIAAHQGLALDASASTDPDAGDLPFLTYAWDVNGDGVFGDANGAQPMLSWQQLVTLGIEVDTSYAVRVRVGDSFGGVTVSAPISLLVSALPGDLNLDGNVDIFDVNAASDHWGTSDPAGDANGDGLVDIFDVNLISDHWTGSSLTLHVAEPSAFPLAALVALAVIGYARRARRGSRRTA